ncbi:MAG: hypothetical protein AAF694_20600 [Bacteroidota bacterium]
MIKLFLSISLGIFSSFCALAIVPGQLSDFQDGTLQGWAGGDILTVNEAGGPQGSGDRFLNVKTDPLSNQAGSRLAAYNGEAGWTGDYLTAGITEIVMDLKNLADTVINLEMRIVFFGPGSDVQSATRFTSTRAIVIPPDNQWHRAVFSIAEDSLTRVFGSDSYNVVMQGVQRVMFRHQPGDPSAGGTSITAGLGVDNVEAIGPTIALGISSKVLLDGFFDEGLGEMHTLLASSDLIPLSQPFNQNPWNYQGAETLAMVPTNMTDWVFLELRDPQDPTQVLSQQACMLTPDGTIMDISGSNVISMDFSGQDSAYLVIRHFSHLSVMSANPLRPGDSFDFTSAIEQANGIGQQLIRGGKALLFSGDYNGNGIINNQDFNNWKQAGAAINQYLSIDGDGNGIVNNLDFNLWALSPSKVGIPEIQY